MFGKIKCCSEIKNERYDSRSCFVTIENLFDSSHFAISIAQCKICKRMFISCYVEVQDWEYGDDDSWEFRTPAEPEEILDLKKDYRVQLGPDDNKFYFRRILDFIVSKDHIVENPIKGRIYWSSEKFEDALHFAISEVRVRGRHFPDMQ